MGKIFKWLIPAVILLIILYLVNPTLWGLLGDDEAPTTEVTAAVRSNIPVSAVVLSPRSIDNKITCHWQHSG